MMATTVTFSGGQQALEAMDWLTKARQRGLLREAAMAGAEIVEAAWQAKAPRLTGALAESGGAGTKLSRRQASLARKEGKSFVEVYAGPGPDPAAIMEEFGNSHQPPHPFMRPAWEESQGRALEAISTTLAAGVAKVNDTAAARLAKNAARDLKRYGG